jgi:hypothetical protein
MFWALAVRLFMFKASRFIARIKTCSRTKKGRGGDMRSVLRSHP